MIWKGFSEEFAPPKYDYSRAGRSDNALARALASVMVSQGWEPAEDSVRAVGFERDFVEDGEGPSRGLYFRKVNMGAAVAALGAELAVDMQAATPVEATPVEATPVEATPVEAVTE